MILLSFHFAKQFLYLFWRRSPSISKIGRNCESQDQVWRAAYSSQTDVDDRLDGNNP